MRLARWVSPPPPAPPATGGGAPPRVPWRRSRTGVSFGRGVLSGVCSRPNVCARPLAPCRCPPRLPSCALRFCVPPRSPKCGLRRRRASLLLLRCGLFGRFGGRGFFSRPLCPRCLYIIECVCAAVSACVAARLIYFCVVSRWLCPSMLCMVVAFTPCAARFVANVCRMMCGLSFLS